MMVVSAILLYCVPRTENHPWKKDHSGYRLFFFSFTYK